MHHVVIDAKLTHELGGLAGQAVLSDANGRVFGFFSPLPSPVQIADLQLEPPLSIAETEELRKVQTGKPLSEILTRLEHS